MTEKPDPFDVAALERSLNDSATRVSTIWVSYLIFALYLLIATGTTTHRQLLLNEPLKLPALNIDLPLFWFFVLAPILFVLLHLYVLLQVLLLGRTARAYNETVDSVIGSAPENALVRQRLANTLFAQIFAGSPREREGWLGWVLRAMAWTTLALAPIVIILAFQFVFLPYHSHLATWTHRLLLVFELGVAFLLWPLVLDARREFNWQELRRRVERTAAVPVRLLSTKDQRRQEWHRLRLQAVPVAACISFVAISLSLASFPGEPHLNLFTGNSLFAVQCDRWISQNFDRLVLPRVDVVDDEKLDKIERLTATKGQRPFQGERTRSFRDHDLTCGTFTFADFRRTDFAGVRMSGAIFANAELQGADLSYSHLDGADLSWSQLQGANLYGSQLQGANLYWSQLHGADLSWSQLQGANLSYAQLQGASLSHSQLHGVDLREAQLQGASLFDAQLQGANLSYAQLQGVDLGEAQLQAADFSGSKLKLALISDAYLWRARNADCSDARVIAPKFDAAFVPKRELILRPIPTAEPEAIEIEKLIAYVVSLVSNRAVGRRLREGLVAAIQKDDLAAIDTNWRDCAANSEKVAVSKYLQQHADFLGVLVCNERREIADGIITHWTMPLTGVRLHGVLGGENEVLHYFSRLASGLLGLDGKECAATKDLSDETKARLRRFASTPIPAN
jgi:uncharacterized protein YjbI with pentapeptide repeats